MISSTRMKFDVLTQAILIVAVGLIFWLVSGFRWTNYMIAILLIWQLGSAIHLYLVYRYMERLNFLKSVSVLLISLPIWVYLIGNLAYIPVAGAILWYFVQSISDMLVVFKRPRSFWDL